MNRFTRSFVSVVCLCFLLQATAHAQANSYKQQNLVTDPTGTGPTKDASLINPWGICIIPGDPFWIADNNSGFSTLYDNTGAPMGSFTVAPPAGSANPAAPTGCVGNAAMTGFNVTVPGGAPASSLFIFATEDGTISGWNGNGSNTILAVDNSANPAAATGAVYKGLAMITNSTGTFLVAANFRSGKVEVYDSSFKVAQLTGSFTDPNPPPIPAGSNAAGWAPFGIHVANNQVVITYALQNPAGTPTPLHDPLHVAGGGFVDLFDLNGNMIRRVTSDSHLNAPWGAVVPPANFGKFSGDLLVGNFGDGTINAFDLTSGNFIDQMKDANGMVITNLSLWELLFDPSGMTGKNPQTMYFTAGGTNESQGFFGAITANAAPPPPAPDFSISTSPTTVTISAGRQGAFTVNVGGLNGFNSAVSLSCSGQPLGSTCTVTPMSVTPASGGTTSATVMIGTSSNPYQMMASTSGGSGSTILALFFPIPVIGFLGLLTVRPEVKKRFGGRRWQPLTRSLALLALATFVLSAAGCYSRKSGTGTQRGMTTVTITGTSGNITHSASVSVTVQ